MYLFRCDDSETYKTTARKQIRDWIRENTPASHHSSSSNSQEHHDAYEWLILHVVVPNTSAAAQPRFSGSTKSSTGTAKDRSTSTRWPGGKSTTIFEKIRSDFNSSSSSAPDRVAQVRIQSSELPPSLQFSGSGVTIPAFQETPQERNNAWSDLVTKFKTLILLSFNWRVSQYEEDIREKDAQRSLPGWNFCTFFVLKEGLAHSFEGVGLVEDALVIYDELSLGLDTVISDKANGASQTDATTFLDYTEEFKQYLHDMLSSNEPNSKLQQMMKKPIGEGNKNYRGLILASNISIFDFKCYLFARQVLLLLRLSRRGFDLGQISRKSQETRRLSLDGAADQRRSLEMPGEVNLGALADICQRALSFATSTSRVMREELRAADEGNKLNADTLDNFIASWTAAIVDQTLAETTSTTLSAGQNNRGPPSPLKTPRTRTTGGDHLSAGDSKSHPGRSNSLSNRPVSLVEPSTAQLSDWPKSPSGDTTRQGDQPVRFGLVELAGHRAELYLLERRILEKLGSKRQWHVGWAAVENTPPRRPNGFHEVNLDAPDSSLRENGAEEHTDSERRLNRGLCHAKLSQAISLEDFRRTYEAWSDDAIRLYRIAGQSRASERILGELAIVKYDSGDLAGAASCFSRVIPLYTEGSWNHVEVAMLRMHAHCLKALHRKDEYVRLLLTILSKAATRTKSTAKRFSKRLSSPGMQNALDTSLSWLDDDDVHARGIMTELVEYSEELPYDISVPMETYFSDIAVEPHVVHYEDRDGYKILLRFRHLLDDDLNLDSLSLKLVGTTAEQKRDIILASEGTMEVEKGMAKCWLHTNVSLQITIPVLLLGPSLT